MSRTIDVSFERDDFATGIDGEGRTFTLSFSYSPSPAIVHWRDIVNKPTEQDPAPFHRAAFTGNYEHLGNIPKINGHELNGNMTSEQLDILTPEDIPEVAVISNDEIDTLLS